MSTAPAKPHSADWFGDSRDFWWNEDFVALMARRWRLGEVHRALDVGAGVGHWGRVILPHLAPGARMVGIDREDTWILEAHRRADQAGIGDRLTYRFGDAARIPFHDGTFDLCTCQTLLIHVADPRAVLREMARVVVPGGLVAVVEPNNLANIMSLGCTLFHADPERQLDVVRLHLVAQRGKEALGEGHNSVGDLLPGMFAEVGLLEVSVYVSDKASALIPPYLGREQQVRRDEMIAMADKEMFAWDRGETRRFFLAGGGSEAEFERLWAVAGAATREAAAALRKGTEHQAGGGLQYLIAGRKPAGAAPTHPARNALR